MKVATLTINKEEVELSKVWVHFKSATSVSVPMSLILRGDYVTEVVDPNRNKPKAQSWALFAKSQLEEFGTVAFEHYINKLRKIEDVSRETPSWVITSIDSVRASDQGLFFEGLAEKFRPLAMPEPKPVE